MTNRYLKFSGDLAIKIGQLDHYSADHQKFLSSGYVCSQCGKTLMKPWGIADITCYSENGERVSVRAARSKGKYAECPKCHYRWKLRVDPNSVEDLVSILVASNRDWMESLDAADGLAKLQDPRGIEYLKASLKSDDRDIQEVAQEILAGLEKGKTIR